MSFLKRTPKIVCAEDIAMAERQQAVNWRGKLEATVYESRQLSEPLSSRRRGRSTVGA
jgi:hypothetical protein